MLVGPRGLYALSRDGLVPRGLSAIHPRYETPYVATLVMTGVTVAFIFAVAGYAQSGWSPDPNKPPFDVITDFIVFGAAVFETLAVASIFVFRRRFPTDRVALPYRCPGYPVVPAVFVVCMVAVMVNMFASPQQRTEALIGLAFIAVGGLVYAAFFARPRT
jgi:amino acid transporter